MKRAANADERGHMGRVQALGCVVCSQCLGYADTPALVHHVRVRHGWGRSSHYATIPLCPVHHENSGYGVHDMGREQFTEMYGMSEIELLTIVNQKLEIPS